MTPALPARKGSVTSCRSGERWTAEVHLGDGKREYDVSLNQTFPTQAAASRAGELIVAEWREQRAGLRDVFLKELAAAYRTLRQTHKTMAPPTVPATRASWDAAIAIWEERGWIEPEDAARYREHVAWAFEAEATREARSSLADDEP